MKINVNHTKTSKCARWIGLAALLTAGAIHAADFYAAPTGQTTGTGSISSPWDLPTALAGAGGRIHPGDSVWLRGGTVPASEFQWIRQHGGRHRRGPDRHPQLPGGARHSRWQECEFVITVHGAYSWFWGLEIMDSNPTRFINQPGEVAPDAFGVGVFAPGVRFINNIVHDTAEGFSSYAASSDSVLYGNLSYYNGWGGTDRNHGHGFYLQNITGIKSVVDNFSSDNADEGFQIYGSGSANVVGFRLFGNVSFNNSSWPFEHYQYNYLIAGGANRKDIQVDQNFSFFTPSANYGFNTFGQYTSRRRHDHHQQRLRGRRGRPRVNCQGGPIVFTGNKIYVQPGGSGSDAADPVSRPNHHPAGPGTTTQYYGKTNFYNDTDGT